MIQLKVPDTEDLKTLKMLLQGETGFPPCQQDLRGFKVNVFPMSGEIIKNYGLHQKKNRNLFSILLVPSFKSLFFLCQRVNIQSKGDPY